MWSSSGVLGVKETGDISISVVLFWEEGIDVIVERNSHSSLLTHVSKITIKLCSATELVSEVDAVSETISHSFKIIFCMIVW